MTNREVLERVPPADIEAEMAVLGSALLRPETLDDIALIITPGDFYDDANRTLYATMVDLYESGSRVDVALLVDRLRTDGQFERVGGAAFLAKISQSVPNAAHARYYAGVVRDKSLLRGLIECASDALSDAFNLDGRAATEIVEMAENRMFAVVERGVALGANVVSVNDAIREALDRIDNRRTGDLNGVPIGLSGVDELLGGLRPRELTVVGGRPGQGKTSFGLGIAAAAAESNSVLFVSLEMSRAELSERMLSMRSRINLYRMRNGTMSADQRRQVVASAAQLSQLRLYLEDSPSRTVSQIGALARRHARRNGLDLLIVDYLQLVTPDNGRDPRQEQVAKMSRRMKQLARELDCAVLVLAQVNRHSADAARAPRLSELRESGAIEQDADIVLFVHRPAEYDPRFRPESADEAEVAQIIIAKHRNGPVGTVDVNWRRECAVFETRDERTDESGWRDTYAEPDPEDWGPPADDTPPTAGRTTGLF